MRVPKVDGSWADVTLLRPVEWIEANEVVAGGTTWVSVPECGIDGHAEVLAVSA